MVGRQRHPDGAPAQSESARHTSVHAFNLVSQEVLRHSKSLEHAAPIPFEPVDVVAAAHKRPRSLVDVWALSFTSPQTSSIGHSAVFRHGARQLFPQSVQVDAQTALRQSPARWQLSPSAPWAELGMHVNV